jgi:hypothetical protein
MRWCCVPGRGLLHMFNCRLIKLRTDRISRLRSRLSGRWPFSIAGVTRTAKRKGSAGTSEQCRKKPPCRGRTKGAWPSDLSFSHTTFGQLKGILRCRFRSRHSRGHAWERNTSMQRKARAVSAGIDKGRYCCLCVEVPLLSFFLNVESAPFATLGTLFRSGHILPSTVICHRAHGQNAQSATVARTPPRDVLSALHGLSGPCPRHCGEAFSTRPHEVHQPHQPTLIESFAHKEEPQGSREQSLSVLFVLSCFIHTRSIYQAPRTSCKIVLQLDAHH